ncbi:hypothetical protein [Flavobacterium hydatis]|jgi:hypothetical protein|uniref:hypothetical protein n=1 Tax=Flavobacterium hydatis TaxID=991 RepID=UPI00103AE889|nr:hypothetical protein [Flavobacterium hydatis]
MTNQNPASYSEFQRITSKDIEILLISISPRTATQYLTDIKKEYGIKTVLFSHFKSYFKIAETSKNT